MPWRDAEEELEAREFPDEDDESEGEDTVACPYCLRQVYEDAVRCPECGEYLSRLDRPSRHPWWLLLGVVLCLFTLLGWVLR